MLARMLLPMSMDIVKFSTQIQIIPDEKDETGFHSESEKKRLKRIETVTIKSMAENPIGLHGILENIILFVCINKQAHFLRRNPNGLDYVEFASVELFDIDKKLQKAKIGTRFLPISIGKYKSID